MKVNMLYVFRLIFTFVHYFIICSKNIGSCNKTWFNFLWAKASYKKFEKIIYTFVSFAVSVQSIKSINKCGAYVWQITNVIVQVEKRNYFLRIPGSMDLVLVLNLKESWWSFVGILSWVFIHLVLDFVSFVDSFVGITKFLSVEN